VCLPQNHRGRATQIEGEEVKDIDQLIDQLNGLKARVEKLKECL
jgi:hypothetical protein